MFETEPDILRRVIDQLREPVEMNSALDRRVMARIAAGPSKTAVIADVWTWLRRPWQLSISPLGAAAVILIAIAAWVAGHRLKQSSAVPRSGMTEVQFVIVAHGASAVSLVGDFNDWDATLTPMHAANGGDLWSVTVPLPAGRHRYAFLVNGDRWMADPSAPRAQDDFGAPSSVVTVGG